MRARLIRGAALALGLAALAATPAGAAPATTGPQGIHSGGPSTVVLDPLPVPTIHVSPRRGTKRTRFVVDYRPASGLPTAGSVGYLVSAYGPRHRGCVSRVLLPPTPLEGGALERARLAPPRHSGGWCTGL